MDFLLDEVDPRLALHEVLLTKLHVQEVTHTRAERMRKVMELRYIEGRTLEQVGNMMGLTRERVRQIEGVALKILRDKLEPRREELVGLLRDLELMRSQNVDNTIYY